MKSCCVLRSLSVCLQILSVSCLAVSRGTWWLLAGALCHCFWVWQEVEVRWAALGIGEVSPGTAESVRIGGENLWESLLAWISLHQALLPMFATSNWKLKLTGDANFRPKGIWAERSYPNSVACPGRGRNFRACGQTPALGSCGSAVTSSTDQDWRRNFWVCFLGHLRGEISSVNMSHSS